MPVLREGKPERDYSKCKPPTWDGEVEADEDWHPWFEPTEPEGTFWLCDKCGAMFIAHGRQWFSEPEMTWKEKHKARKLRREYLRKRRVGNTRNGYTGSPWVGHKPPRIPTQAQSGISRH